MDGTAPQRCINAFNLADARTFRGMVPVDIGRLTYPATIDIGIDMSRVRVVRSDCQGEVGEWQQLVQVVLG